jgi:oligoribonuclease NrnB/cAMP/cGMP phosphodiesterase (DHH superfamily)
MAFQSKKFVIYHANCMDGLGAAAAAKMSPAWSDATFIPCAYSKEKEVVEMLMADYLPALLVVDFSFSEVVTRELIKHCSSFMVIDHHKTHMRALQHIPVENKVFDMRKSGAVLTWEYLHPTAKVPLALQYIQDRDLWKWELKDSKEFNAALKVDVDNSLERMTDIITVPHFADEDSYNLNLRDNYTIAGEALTESVYQQVKQKVEDYKKSPICVRLWCNNYPIIVPFMNATENTSELGNAIAELSPLGISATWQVKGYGKVIVSLRATESSEIDVSDIATTFSGGGHKKAAGFTTGYQFLDKQFLPKGV